MRPVKAGLWPMLATSVLLTACGTSASGPPSAQDILNKPNTANVRDAHFTLVAHVVTGNPKQTHQNSRDAVVVQVEPHRL